MKEKILGIFPINWFQLLFFTDMYVYLLIIQKLKVGQNTLLLYRKIYKVFPSFSHMKNFSST